MKKILLKLNFLPMKLLNFIHPTNKVRQNNITVRTRGNPRELHKGI